MTKEEVQAKISRFETFLGDIEPGVFGFFGDFRWLSNFHLSTIKIGNTPYASVEHAYQAAKATNKEDRERIRLANTPARAKQIGSEIKLREDWEEVKLGVMEALLRLKFQDPELRQKLINTHPYPLIEDNWWKDRFWGVYNDKGENHLGKLLMKIRDDYIIQA